MPYPTIQEVQGLPDPAPSWMWEMDINLPGDRLISHLYVLEVTFPFSYIDIVGRYRAGSFLYFPGHSNIDNVTVNFYETEDFRILQAFKVWQLMVIDAEGNYGIPFQFLGDVTLHLYDGKGQERASCNLTGCWPAKLSDWSLNYQSSNHLQVSVNFAVNSSVFTFYDGAGGVIANNSRLNAAPVQPQINNNSVGSLDTLVPSAA